MKTSTVLILAGVGFLAWYLYKQNKVDSQDVYVEAQPSSAIDAANIGANNIASSVVNDATYTAENFINNLFGINGQNE